MARIERDIRWFLAKVDVRGEDECWTWLAAKTKDGYGSCSRLDQRPGSQLAHRASYQLFVGPIPAGLCVLHRCDNPPCVNPRHLFTGTQKDNIYDCMAKGRRRKEQPCPKLDKSLRAELVNTYLSRDITYAELGRIYGLTYQYVRHLLQIAGVIKPDPVVRCANDNCSGVFIRTAQTFKRKYCNSCSPGRHDRN